MLQSDNAGENKMLQKALKGEEFNIDFQHTAAGTPQLNGRVEQKKRLYMVIFAQH